MWFIFFNDIAHSVAYAKGYQLYRRECSLADHDAVSMRADRSGLAASTVIDRTSYFELKVSSAIKKE